MGLDMNMYETLGEELTIQDLFEEDKYETLPCWYWRKANQIHKWFVDNIQGGVDNCEVYEVSIDQIKKLHRVVKETLRTKNTSKLPPDNGFFFGSTTVDEFYWEDLRSTKKYLEEMIHSHETTGTSRFFYHASW